MLAHTAASNSVNQPTSILLNIVCSRTSHNRGLCIAGSCQSQIAITHFKGRYNKSLDLPQVCILSRNTVALITNAILNIKIQSHEIVLIINILHCICRCFGIPFQSNKTDILIRHEHHQKTMAKNRHVELLRYFRCAVAASPFSMQKPWSKFVHSWHGHSSRPVDIAAQYNSFQGCERRAVTHALWNQKRNSDLLPR